MSELTAHHPDTISDHELEACSDVSRIVKDLRRARGMVREFLRHQGRCDVCRAAPAVRRIAVHSTENMFGPFWICDDCRVAGAAIDLPDASLVRLAMASASAWDAPR